MRVIPLACIRCDMRGFPLICRLASVGLVDHGKHFGFFVDGVEVTERLCKARLIESGVALDFNAEIKRQWNLATVNYCQKR